MLILCARAPYLWQINVGCWNSASVICVLLWSGARLKTEIARILFISLPCSFVNLKNCRSQIWAGPWGLQCSITSSVYWKDKSCSVFAFVEQLEKKKYGEERWISVKKGALFLEPRYFVCFSVQRNYCISLKV